MMPLLVWIFLGICVLWLLIHRTLIRALRRDLEAARRDMYRVQYEMQEAVHAIETELLAVHLEERLQRGHLKVGPNTTIAEAFAMHPAVSSVLGRYHITANSPGQETLAAAATTYGQNLEALLTEVTRTLENPDGAGTGPHTHEPTPGEGFSV